jgi:hypothetical protein
MKARANQYPLRLPRSLKASAKVMAELDGLSLNQFICLAVAEKVQHVEETARASSPETGQPESQHIRTPPNLRGMQFAGLR